MKGKDPDYITENFDYVVKMFDKEADEQKTLISEEAMKSSKVITEKVDTPRQKPREGQSHEGSSEEVSEYLSAMKRQDRFKN